MQWIATFIVLSVLGIIDAGYLVWKHRQHQPLACPLNHDCSHVTESKWAKIFGVRNDILGLLFYVGMLGGAVALLFVPVALAATLAWYMFLATAGGLLFSIALMIIQFAIIKDYCFYCLISAGLTIFLFVNSLALV